jgi:membrane protein implicated in regulation of membrane protease activity
MILVNALVAGLLYSALGALYAVVVIVPVVLAFGMWKLVARPDETTQHRPHIRRGRHIYQTH